MIVAIASFAIPASAETFSGWVVTENDELTVRDKSSTSGTKIGSLPRGITANFSTLGKNETNWKTWFSVRTTQFHGYVKAEYIAISTSAYGAFTGDVKTAGGKLNIREEPSANSTVLYTVDNGSTVAIIDLDSVSGWYRVSTPSGTGWASKEYIKSRG